MSTKKTNTDAILHFCEAQRPQTPKVSQDYLETYSKKLDARLTKLCFIRQETGILHNSPEWGDTLYAYVKSGDIDGLTRFYYMERNWIPGMPTNDPLRDGKNNAISMMSVIANFIARDKLMDPELSYTISDACIQLVEESKTLKDVQSNAFAGIYKYTQLVQEYRQRTYHPLVQQVKTYVNQHLHEEIYVRDIARELSVSPEYLTRVFKNSEGIGPKNYVIGQRIMQVKKLLQFSGMTIPEISRYLGFSSQSHMTEVFRKSEGMTPQQFRKEYQK